MSYVEGGLKLSFGPFVVKLSTINANCHNSML